jgi:hypothetical protein
VSTTITTTVDIEASPEAVWAVLIDFPAYRDWNPFMDHVIGNPAVGEKLVVHMKPNGGRGMTFKPTVLVATPGQELRWLGKLGVRGLFDGEHSFALHDNGGGTTRLTHSETFSGVLVALLKRTLGNTETGFTAFNEALKQRVEMTNRVPTEGTATGQPGRVHSPPSCTPLSTMP